MAAALYPADSAKAFAALLKKTGGTCYQIAGYSGLSEPYLWRLLKGQKQNPSPGVVTRISLAIASLSSKADQHDFESLFNAVGRTLFIKY